MDELAKRSSTLLIATGAAAIAFGLIAAFWPIASALTLVVLWGFYAMVDGIVAIAAAVRGGVTGTLRIFLLVVGAIGVLAGLVAVFRPVSSAVALTWVLGIWLIARGVMELASAFGSTDRPKWLLALGGVLWIVAGLLFTSNPGGAAVSLALWLGFLAIFWGVAMVTAGFVARSQHADAPATTS